MDSRLQIQELVAKAHTAQKTFEGFDQRQVDAVVRAIARVVYEQAAPLARMAVEETRMGVYEDKVKKNQGKAKIIWHHLKNKPSVGILRRDAVTGIVEIAKPMGVVGAVTPCTNPIVTPMCNAMFALKCRNAIILAPHPRARRCAEHVTDLFRDAISALGAPADLVQVLKDPSVELTGELMKAVDVVIATGGMGMVRAAYSSGKPAYGVGTGNVQCILDKGYDAKVAVPKIVAGRVFDNGIICSGEQTLFIHRDDFASVVAVLEAEGASLVTVAEDKERLRRALFVNGAANKDATGQSALRIAELCGIFVPAGTRLLVCEADGPGEADILCREKMCPVLTLIRYDTFEQAVDLALEGLEVDGKGHSISIHSNDEARIEYAAGRAPVSRVLVNQICATMNGGSFFNGFTPTTTLGCGSWGGNSISENLDYRHLMNITRIGHYMKDAVVPTDDALWG
jgi:succinate-semialdehyde dehydrogenase